MDTFSHQLKCSMINFKTLKPVECSRVNSEFKMTIVVSFHSEKLYEIVIWDWLLFQHFDAKLLKINLISTYVSSFYEK